MFRLNYRAISVPAILAVLAACSGVTPSGGMTFARPDRTESWISPEAAKATSLLYISDLGDGYVVHVYTFPGLELVGKLTGFAQPQGECSDAAGNVWITDTNAREVFEYKHAGKTPINALLDPTGFPVGCAIDPPTGDLAVTNIFDFSGGGGVLIYRHAAGAPRSYSNPHQFYYYFAGYDSAGDLYASGQNSSQAYLLSVLRKGATSMSTVSITGGTIDFPGTVQWLGSTLVLGDQKCNDSKSSCLYEASVSGKTARITHRIVLTACDVAQALIFKHEIVGGDYAHCKHGVSSTDIWAFPAGGNPIKRAGGVEAPVGAAISTP